MTEEKKAYDEWMQRYTCNDPYWKLPTRYMDPSRVGGMYKKIERFEKLYPKCVDDLFSGLPSYYCVLCVSKDATQEEIKDAYERKKRCSNYPDDVIERAYEMLNDTEKSAEYEKILRIFPKILMGFTATEKREIKEAHNRGLDMEKNRATWGYIMENRGGWIALLHRGAPSFYEVLNLDRTELKLELKINTCDEVRCDDSDAGVDADRGVDEKLREEICRILNNAQLRFEYDFLLDGLAEILDDGDSEEIKGKGKGKRALWEGKPASYLMLLRYYNYIEQYEEIMSEHPDWGKYIDDKTFYDILNIDAASIPVDKQEAENFIRNAYKDKERTAEVNLAYSVLKNFRLRDAYNWWLKHSEWVSVIQQFDIETVDVAEDEAEIRRALELAEVRVRESG